MKTTASFQTGIPYFDKLKAWDGKAEYKLDTPRQLLKDLGNPQNSTKIIHVAGTNGKGSVSCYLAAILLAAGEERVGLHCSPHLSDICERLIIDGSPVERELLISASEEVEAAATAAGLQPSFFEGVVAAVFLLARQQQLSWLVLETGLGGRLDATNLVQSPEAVVITNVGFDHTHILGQTLREIAREKAGIIKQAVPVFLGQMPKEAKEEIVMYAEQQEAVCSIYGQDFFFKGGQSHLSAKLSLDRKIFSLNSFAAHQENNKLLAAKVASELGFGAWIEAGLRKAIWPGRFEVIEYKSKIVILDVAHNPEGISGLLESLDLYLKDKVFEKIKKVCFLISCLDRKDWKKMLKLVTKHHPEAELVFTQSGHSHAVPVEELVDFTGVGLVEKDSAKALELALEHQLIIICGSIFLVGELRPLLIEKPFNTFKAAELLT